MFRDKLAIIARIAPIWWKTAVFLVLFGLSLGSMINKSPTFDEQGFITRGLGYLRDENKHIRVGHPLGLNALNTSLLVFDHRVLLPTDDPSWQGTGFHRPAELFLWESGNDVERVMFLARLPTIWLGMLLAAVVSRWAWELAGDHRAGLVALVVIGFDPNILAHSRLATTDLGLTFGVTLASFLLWCFLRQPNWQLAVLAGAGFGLLQNTKFTSGLFVPLFALGIFVVLASRWRENGRFPTTMLLQLIFIYPTAAFLTLWVANGFQAGLLPGNLPIFPQLSGLTLPLSHHVEQLLDIGGRLQKETPSFLWGQYSDSGWWYYFPVAFFLKTPLPTLILLVWAFGHLVWEKMRPDPNQLSRFTTVDLAMLIIPSFGYFAIALTSDINLGYRHLLPVLPFLAVFVVGAIWPGWANRSKKQGGGTQPLEFLMIFVLAIWLIAASFRTFPHYLAYFNNLAGGSDGGWHYLVDSNIDWGQDLAGLKTWMEDNEVDHVWLSYFGEARPEYYGINHTGLDSFPPRLMSPGARPYYPHDQAPGIYAISATNLQGVHFADHDQFAFFRDREPLAKIGYSIFLFEVEAYGEPADLALGGLQLDEIDPADFALWQTNQVMPHWFDPAQSFLIPQGNPRWLALATEGEVSPILQAVVASWKKVAETPAYNLYQIPPLSPDTAVPIATFANDSGTIGLMDGTWEKETAVAGELITLQTDWRKSAPPQPLQIFLHLTDADGNIIAQWDGLGAAWEGWRDGDRLWQNHQLIIPATAQSGIYQFNIGLYHPQTGQRWLTAAGHDYFTLGTIMILE